MISAGSERDEIVGFISDFSPYFGFSVHNRNEPENYTRFVLQVTRMTCILQPINCYCEPSCKRFFNTAAIRKITPLELLARSLDDKNM